jgi:hypothetical protein
MSLRLLLALIVLPATLALTACTTGDDDDNAGDCTDLTAAANPPTITTSAPNDGAIFAAGDSINVVANVSDPNADATDLSVELSDVINVTPEDIGVPAATPDADGRVAFSIPGGTFDEGDHVLRVEVVDPDGCTANDEILICIDTQSCPSS